MTYAAALAGSSEDDEGGEAGEGGEHYVIKRDLGGNIIRTKVVEPADEETKKGEKRTREQAQKAGKDEPPTKKQNTTNPTTELRLTEAAVQQELIKYGGRRKTRDVLKRFKKLLNTADDKALFRDILRTICTVEVDPIDGRILVLKSQFR